MLPQPLSGSVPCGILPEYGIPSLVDSKHPPLASIETPLLVDGLIVSHLVEILFTDLKFLYWIDTGCSLHDAVVEHISTIFLVCS